MDKFIDDKTTIYNGEKGEIKVEVSNDTVWLTQEGIAELFNVDKTVIIKHINDILAEGELDNEVCAKFARTSSDGKAYDNKYYNLDMIISLGYRINPKRGIDFRRRAAQILKEYLIQEYRADCNKGIDKNVNHRTVEVQPSTLTDQIPITESRREILSLIKTYAQVWDLLIEYDENKLNTPLSLQFSQGDATLSYQEAMQAVYMLQTELKRRAGNLFGIEKGNAFKNILREIEQTFRGRLLYPSVEERAARLLYFIIKDRPFSIGNKRIGALLFLLYLTRSKITLKNIGVNSITPLTLLIEESNFVHKDSTIKLIMNLISE